MMKLCRVDETQRLISRVGSSRKETGTKVFKSQVRGKKTVALPSALGKNLGKDLRSRTRCPPGQDESESGDSSTWLLKDGVDLPHLFRTV